MGACTAVYTAGIDRRIKSVVAMSGIADCREWLKYVWEYQKGDFREFEESVNREAEIAAATGAGGLRNVLDMYHFPDKDRADKILEVFADPDACEYVVWDTMQELMMYRPLDQ